MYFKMKIGKSLDSEQALPRNQDEGLASPTGPSYANFDDEQPTGLKQLNTDTLQMDINLSDRNPSEV